MDSLEIINLKKSYGKVKAVDNISFSVMQGEIFGFLGPNGAGKTTTINCITQLSTIDSGKITVNGFDVVKDYLDARTQIGLSPQEIQFDPFFKIFDVLVYQAGYFGIKSKDAKKRAEKLMKEFGLWEKRNTTMRALSGGMKRKFSILKAIMHEPKILILDEPTAGLDVDSRYELWDFIKKLNKNGITIILTTHYIEEAEKLTHRVGIINKGKIIKLDDTSKIVDDLSQNIISIYLEKETKLPKEFKKFNFKQEGKKIDINISKKLQSKILRESLKILEDNNIVVENFNVQQDNLENIFRRLVNEN